MYSSNCAKSCYLNLNCKFNFLGRGSGLSSDILLFTYMLESVLCTRVHQRCGKADFGRPSLDPFLACSPFSSTAMFYSLFSDFLEQKDWIFPHVPTIPRESSLPSSVSPSPQGSHSPQGLSAYGHPAQPSGSFCTCPSFIVLCGFFLLLFWDFVW